MLFDDKAANPFKDPPHRVVVKATQGDWVNYRWETGSMWQNGLSGITCGIHDVVL